jgi:hypothetical protein
MQPPARPHPQQVQPARIPARGAVDANRAGGSLPGPHSIRPNNALPPPNRRAPLPQSNAGAPPAAMPPIMQNVPQARRIEPNPGQRLPIFDKRMVRPPPRRIPFAQNQGPEFNSNPGFQPQPDRAQPPPAGRQFAHGMAAPPGARPGEAVQGYTPHTGQGNPNQNMMQAPRGAPSAMGVPSPRPGYVARPGTTQGRPWTPGTSVLSSAPTPPGTPGQPRLMTRPPVTSPGRAIPGGPLPMPQGGQGLRSTQQGTGMQPQPMPPARPQLQAWPQGPGVAATSSEGTTRTAFAPSRQTAPSQGVGPRQPVWQEGQNRVAAPPSQGIPQAPAGGFVPPPARGNMSNALPVRGSIKNIPGLGPKDPLGLSPDNTAWPPVSRAWRSEEDAEEEGEDGDEAFRSGTKLRGFRSRNVQSSRIGPGIGRWSRQEEEEPRENRRKERSEVPEGMIANEMIRWAYKFERCKCACMLSRLVCRACVLGKGYERSRELSVPRQRLICFFSLYCKMSPSLASCCPFRWLCLCILGSSKGF